MNLGFKIQSKPAKPAVAARIPGVADPSLPMGWEASAQVKTFRKNPDGTVTVRVSIQLSSPEKKKFASEFQVVRLQGEKE